MTQSQNTFNQSINRLKYKWVNWSTQLMIVMSKPSLTNLWPFLISNHIDLAQELWCLESFVYNFNEASISSQPLDLDQYRIFENHISESVLILMLVNLELESPILQNHILFLKNECKPDLHFFDLDPILEPISTPKLVLDLNQIFESVMVPELLTLEPINRLTKSYSIVG